MLKTVREEKYKSETKLGLDSEATLTLSHFANSNWHLLRDPDIRRLCWTFFINLGGLKKKSNFTPTVKPLCLTSSLLNT